MDEISVEYSVEWELAEETEVLGGNMPNKSHMIWSGIEAGQLQWEAGDYRLSYGIRKIQ
jgi:hypothetical protein